MLNYLTSKICVKKNSKLYAIYFMLFLDGISEGLIFPLLPELFIDKNRGIMTEDSILSRPLFYGVSCASFPLFSIFGVSILGYLSDRYKKINVILLSLGMLILSYLLCFTSILIHNVWIFLASRSLSGFFSGNNAIANAIIIDTSTTKRQRINSFKLATFSSMLGFISGPGIFAIINLFVNSFHQLITPIIIAFILGILNWLMIFYNFRNEIKTKPNINRSLLKYSSNSLSCMNYLVIYKFIQDSILHVMQDLKSSLFYIFHDSKFRFLAISCLLFEFGFGVFVQSIILSLSTEYGYSPYNIGKIYMQMSLIMAFNIYCLQGFISRYISYQVQLKLGLIISSILMICNSLIYTSYFFQLTGEKILIITINLFYFFVPFVILSFTNMFADFTDKSNKGKVMGGRGQLHSIGWFISGITTGYCAQFGHTTLFVSGIFFLVSYLILKLENASSAL